MQTTQNKDQLQTSVLSIWNKISTMCLLDYGSKILALIACPMVVVAGPYLDQLLGPSQLQRFFTPPGKPQTSDCTSNHQLLNLCSALKDESVFIPTMPPTGVGVRRTVVRGSSRFVWSYPCQSSCVPPCDVKMSRSRVRMLSELWPTIHLVGDEPIFWGSRTTSKRWTFLPKDVGTFKTLFHLLRALRVENFWRYYLWCGQFSCP